MALVGLFTPPPAVVVVVAVVVAVPAVVELAVAVVGDMEEPPAVGLSTGLSRVGLLSGSTSTSTSSVGDE